MKARNSTWRQVAAVTAVICGSAFVVSFDLSAAAAHIVRPGGICVVKATGFAVDGQVRLVTAAATVCGAGLADVMKAAEGGGANKKLVNVGYGCHLKNFSKKATCWYFAVKSPGCVKNVAWIWPVLGVMKNDMSSWKAINSCHSGRVYRRANLKGRFVTCRPSCRTLGRYINDHDVSLKAGYGRKHP